MELTTAPATPDGDVGKQSNVYFMSVDYDGNLMSIDYDVEVTMETNVDRYDLLEVALKQYNNKLVNIRGLSNIKNIDNRNFETDKFKIKARKSIIEHTETKAAYYGSVIECVEGTIRLTLYDTIFSMGLSAGDIKVKCVPKEIPENSHILNLCVLGDKGFEIIRGYIHHEFKDDYNQTCVTCIEGLKQYVGAINKINSYVINANKDAKIEGEFIVDFDTSNDRVITENIYESFYSYIELAKIRKIRFERIK